MTTSDGSTEEYTGGSVGYYKAWVANPTTPGVEPYMAECNDIIEALDMNYAEANVFKANWRRAAARQGLKKRGYTDGLYDAEKMVFFSERVVVQEKHANKSAEPYPDTVLDLGPVWDAGEERIRNIASSHGDGEHYAEDMSDPANWRAGDLLKCVDGDQGFIGVETGEICIIDYVEITGGDVNIALIGKEIKPLAHRFRFHSRPSQVKEAEMSGIWHHYDGGGMPCDELSHIEIMCKDGTTERGQAKGFEWEHIGHADCDIIRYRML